MINTMSDGSGLPFSHEKKVKSQVIAHPVSQLRLSNVFRGITPDPRRNI